MVHPHVRGVDALGVAGGLGFARFIPTGVGQFMDYAIEAIDPSVHPHGRGADVTVETRIAASGGSSPRAWGRWALAGQGAAGARFIPTGVGQISRSSGCGTIWTVHPHGRGADPDFDVRTHDADGSSPRAWGRSSGFRFVGQHSRFIPTGVGQMLSAAPVPTPQSGSSPRAWGRFQQAQLASAFFRFIPTGVGQMTDPVRYLPDSSVHPHGRGADGFQRYTFTLFPRFIPTGVGQMFT